jgi:IrrE N-terminal-like domain
MANDYLVKERSNDECRALAKTARTWCDQADARYLDVCACVSKNEIWTVYGIRRLVLEIKPDAELGKDDAVTTFAAGIITITVKQSCWDGAKRGQVRHRQTLAHELGHAVQGHGEMRADAPMARRQAASGKYLAPVDRPSNYKSAEGLPASKSAEHQAKVFAPAFLINDRIAETLSSANEIALAFGISQQSAEIYFEQLTKRRNKKKSAERVRRMADEAIAVLSGRRSAPTNYMPDPCLVCGEKKILPNVAGFQCQNCGKVFDHQDGDTVAF